jgi:hypothetical protein
MIKHPIYARPPPLLGLTLIGALIDVDFLHESIMHQSFETLTPGTMLGISPPGSKNTIQLLKDFKNLAPTRDEIEVFMFNFL